MVNPPLHRGQWNWGYYTTWHDKAVCEQTGSFRTLPPNDGRVQRFAMPPPLAAQPVMKQSEGRLALPAALEEFHSVWCELGIDGNLSTSPAVHFRSDYSSLSIFKSPKPRDCS